MVVLSISVSSSSLYCKVYFFLLLYFWIASIGVKKIEKEAKRKYPNRRNRRRPYNDGRRSGGAFLSISASLFLYLSFLSIALSLSPWSNLSMGFCFFFFISRENLFLLAVCVNKWKEWMIVCFGFQFLERAIFDLLISLSSVLCLSISLSLFSLGLSFSFFYPCSNLFFFCLQQLVSFYTKRAVMSGLVSKSESFKRIVRFFLKN